MPYPVNPMILAALNDLEWDCLLAYVWNAPLPRRVVRMSPHDASGIVPPGERRSYALMRVAEGVKKADIARDLGVSPSLLSKILKGERN